MQGKWEIFNQKVVCHFSRTCIFYQDLCQPHRWVLIDSLDFSLYGNYKHEEFDNQTETDVKNKRCYLSVKWTPF